MIKSHSTCFVVQHMSDPCMYKIVGLCFGLRRNKYEDEGKRSDCVQLVMGTSNELELVLLLIKSLTNRLLCLSVISLVIYELGIEEILLVLCIVLQSMVAIRMITDERMDRWTDAWTVAIGSSVTWMHYSVHHEVTWG